MWSVFHKIQGSNGPIRHDKEYGFPSNTQHIRKFEVKPSPSPQDPQKLSPAYGYFVYGKLIRNLNNDELVLRRKAILGIEELFAQKKEHIIAAVDSDLIPTLLRKLDHNEDEFVHEHTLNVFSQISTTLLSRQQICSKSCISAVCSSVEHENMQSNVSVKAIRALSFIGFDQLGQETLIDNDVIPLLLKCIRNGSSDAKRMAIKALLKCLTLEKGKKTAIEENAVKDIDEYLSNINENNDRSKDIIKCWRDIFDCIAYICVIDEGKKECVKFEILEKVVNSLQDIGFSSGENILESATLAIMMISIDIEGKKQALQTEVIPHLFSFIENFEIYSESVVVYSLRALTNISEDPQGRKIILNNRTLIERIEKNHNESDQSLIHKAAIKALSVIKWSP